MVVFLLARRQKSRSGRGELWFGGWGGLVRTLLCVCEFVCMRVCMCACVSVFLSAVSLRGERGELWLKGWSRQGWLCASVSSM